MDEATARRAWLAGARWAHGRPLSEATATVAFAVWWAGESGKRQPPERVPDDAPSWWHGRWSETGRHLYDHRGRRVKNPALAILPLDGGYAPRRTKERRPGEFQRTVVTSNGDVYTILAWWDPSQGDGADGNACFIVRGDHAFSSKAMTDAFPVHFPRQALQLAARRRQLIEVARDDP